ncbi:hypothetical protein, partial [Sulfuricurvum sp.]|uniref:hypothetical protein n=1 Tax=Sulfuricurvum sp. TaxID=2025608 RepID=UPI0026079B02
HRGELMSMVLLEKISIGVVVFALTVSSAFALEPVKVVKHHRGIQNVILTPFSKTSIRTVAHGHRGIYNYVILYLK